MKTFTRIGMRTFIAAVSILMTCLCVPSHAADGEGKFAAKGAARKSCSQFLESAQDKSSDYLLYGGWVEGYISGYNQFQPENYDITPWQTTELLMILLRQHCSANPQVRFLDATNSLIKAFFPIRLEQESPIIAIKVGEGTTYHFHEILLRAEQRLKFLGYFEGEPDGKTFTEEDTRAFAAYQQKHGLKVTGVPDQHTLASLFLKRKQ